MLQAVQTRGQLQREKVGNNSLKVSDVVNNDMSADETKKAQQDDPSLNLYRKHAYAGTKKLSGSDNVSWYVVQKGFLYRYFQSPKLNDNKIFKQRVVPNPHRVIVMKLAHDSILSGHLGIQKTTDRILSSFYWPEIQGYCSSCYICQRTFPKGKVSRVPLVKMPLIDTPIEMVAVDLVGPISHVKDRGDRYILTS